MDKNAYIKDNYLKQSDEEMAQACNISVDAVMSRRYAMKLYRPSNKTRKEKPRKKELIDMSDIRVSENGLRRWFVTSDWQVPFHDVKALALVEKYMENQTYDGYLHLGDLMDFDFISTFNKDKPRKTADRFFAEDYELTNKLLDRHQKIIRRNNPKARFVLLEGNHEERVERYLDMFPMFKGMVDVEVGLKLQERGFEWVRSWSKGDVYHVGKAAFVHGQYTSKYHAAKMVDTYGESIFYGHTHDIMDFPKVQKGSGSLLVGQSIGCLCEYEQSYMRGKPSNWQQGFMELWLLPNGHYTYHITRIINYEFVGLDGKLYTL